MAFFSHDSEADLRSEIEALRRQVTAMGRSMSKRGERAFRDTRNEASGLYEDLAERVSDTLPAVRRHARDIEETIRDNPTRTLAVVGLAALAVAAAYMMSGNRR